jgi:HAD superfamily hydrolase (TIGR01490 family)
MNYWAIESIDVVFCDVDDTIIRGKSLLGFAQCLIRHLPADDAGGLASALSELLAGLKRGEPRTDLNRRYYAAVIGRRARAEVLRIARAWYEEASAQAGFYKEAVCDFLARAKTSGAKIVLLTGSFPDLIEPIAERVGAAHMLAAPLEIESGWYTGRLLGEPTVESGKLSALSEYVRANGLTLSRCAGIGDDVSDLPFLNALGFPIIPPDGQIALVKHAARHGWQVLPEVASREAGV